MRGILCAIIVLTLAACAQTYEPVVDLKGVDQNKYQADLAECRAYAEKVSPVGEAATGAVLGAALGAGIGAIAGAAGGDVSTGAGYGAAIGGTAGLAGGGAHGVSGQIEVINNCLRGRGYKVLR
jgi:hypothetical protein